MTASTEKQCKCRLCGDYFSDSEMSEEHYPARNTGNEDIVAVDLGKMFDTFISENVHAEIRQKLDNGQTLESIAGDIFDSQLATSLFPKGITSKSRNHLEKGFELCYNTIKPTRAITIYPKRDLSPLIRF